MLKKILSLAMVVCMMLSASCVLAEETYVELPAGVAKEDGINGYFVYEDFEDEEVGTTPSVYYTSVAMQVVNGIEGNSLPSNALLQYGNANLTYNNSLKINDNRGAFYNFPAKTESAYVMMETDFMLPNAAPISATEQKVYTKAQARVSLNYYFGKWTNTNTTTKEAKGGLPATDVVITANGDGVEGSMQVYQSFYKDARASRNALAYTHVNIVPDTWYKLSIVADTVKGMYDIYIDDALVISSIYFAQPLSSISTYNDNEHALRSVVLGGGASEGETVAVGELVGSGIRATAENTASYAAGNPYPVLYDNLKVASVTPAYVGNKAMQGIKEYYRDGSIYNNDLMIPTGFVAYPKTGVIEENDYAVNAGHVDADDNPLAGKLRIRPGYTNPVTAPNVFEVLERGAEDVTGDIYFTYTKDAGETDNASYDINSTVTIPLTLRGTGTDTGIADIKATSVLFYKGVNGKVEAAVDLSNASGTAFDATVLVCSYKGNKLTGVELAPVSVAGGSTDVTVSGAIKPASDDTKVKAFVWVMDTLIPVVDGEYSLAQ